MKASRLFLTVWLNVSGKAANDWHLLAAFHTVISICLGRRLTGSRRSNQIADIISLVVDSSRERRVVGVQMRPLEEHRRLSSTSSVIIVVIVVIAEYEWFDDVLDHTGTQWITFQPRVDALMCGVFRTCSQKWWKQYTSASCWVRFASIRNRRINPIVGSNGNEKSLPTANHKHC